MDEAKEQITSSAKVILGIKDDAQDELIGILADDIINAVLSYCRIDVLPRQLIGLIAIIVSEKLRSIDNGGIKSVTEGERRVEYSDENYDFLSEYASRLKPFVSRSVKFPSDLEAEENDKSV
jgi:hypothetical protein